MAEIVPVVSEALEAQIRNLLPSQRGFGEDLQASNVITPIIDLTAAAQGTVVPQILQTAINFGNATGYNATNSTVVLANSPGFYRIFGVSTLSGAGASGFTMTDGISVKSVWSHQAVAAGQSTNQFDFVVFLSAGDSISATSNSTNAINRGQSSQIADVNGNINYPAGFTPQ